MELSRAGFAIVAGACISAGAGAGYLATRGITPVVTAQPVESAAITDAALSEPIPLPAPAPTLTAERALAMPAAPAPAPRPSPPVSQPEPPRVRPRPAPEPQAAPVAIFAPGPPSFETEVNPVVPASIDSAPPELHLPAPIAEPADLVEIGLPVDSVIGLQLETPVSSESAAVEDEVIARVTRDVKVGGHVAVPAGSTVRGEVTLVERGGKLRERARLGVRFTSVVRSDGIEVPIATETIFREGDSPGRESATKIGGGAIGGAIIGGILGGGKGAAIGGSIGAGAGSAAVFAGGRNPATLPAGAPVTIRLQEPARIVTSR